ncbi:MAG: hypothetical protein DI586_05280 [Micavibrio aeruginosavorus]|uniref:Uncharacterized protein n=1 Tax=Micavibrio aeruginosavorus TaxID=349221 RepID=A0A2W5HJS7_9BACT|nr:MAG: hypothetical protein DI586_05280 [Micavibrio aeruginosavorus]
MDYNKEKNFYDKPLKPGTILLVFVVLFAGMLIYREVKGIPEQEARLQALRPPPTQKLSQSLIVGKVGALCKMAVTEKLVVPKSADFPWSAQIIPTTGDREFTMTSFVDAQNSYGASVRTHFQCRVTYNGQDADKIENWTVVSISGF